MVHAYCDEISVTAFVKMVDSLGAIRQGYSAWKKFTFSSSIGTIFPIPDPDDPFLILDPLFYPDFYDP